MPLPRLTTLIINKRNPNAATIIGRGNVRPPFRIELFAFSTSDNVTTVPSLRELTVSVNTTTEKEIATLFYQVPHVVRLKLAGRCLEKEGPPAPILPDLEELELTIQDRMLPLSFIRAPRLRSLDFHFQQYDVNWFASSWLTEEAWISGFPAWFPELRHLHITGVANFSSVGRTYDSFVAAFIRSHPQLERVEIAASTPGADNGRRPPKRAAESV